MTATQHGGRHRRFGRRDHLGRRLTTASMVGAAGWLLTAEIVEPQPTPAPRQAAVEPPAHEPTQHQQIQRSGEVIAVTQDSLTTATPAGTTTTFRITPETAKITAPALKGNAVDLGVVHDGVPVATAVAGQGAVGPVGPPMDYGLPT